jgi:hypothetical protein
VCAVLSACCAVKASPPRDSGGHRAIGDQALNQCDRHLRSYLQNTERQFLSAFLLLCRLAVDKNPKIALLVFYEEIEILLVDLSFF